MRIMKKFICHCSGSLSSDIFINADMSKIFICSIYPKYALIGSENFFSKLSQKFFENKKFIKAVKKLAAFIVMGNFRKRLNWR